LRFLAVFEAEFRTRERFPKRFSRPFGESDELRPRHAQSLFV